MICYLDFEANGITQTKEIISVGAVAETGETFYSLVRPHTKLDHKIKELTGIQQDEAEIAPSIEKVMENFWDWIYVTFGKLPTFYTFSNHDKEFINGSIAVTDSVFARELLAMIRDRIEDVSGDIAKKFNRDSIRLRSAYLTMRLSSNEPLEQKHNALDDAEMLKYVWENMETYEFPEDGEVVKIPRENMRYGRKKANKMAEKYRVPIKVWTNGKKTGYKEWIFQNVAAASGMFSNTTKKNKRLKVMDQILACAEQRQVYHGKHVEIVDK